MAMEFIVGSIGVAFILLTVFFIITLLRLQKVIKKTDLVLKETHHLIRSISEPSVELIENTNELILDVKKKSEGIDVIFQPLYNLKREKSNVHRFDKICELVGCIADGIELFRKIKNEIKR